MQSLFTQATVVVELLSAGYVATSFVSYTHRRLQQPSTNATPAVRSWSQTLASSWSSTLTMSAGIQSMMTTIAATPRPLSPVEQLRRDCQTVGIKWRNAHGLNRHLKKAEMLAALEQVRSGRGGLANEVRVASTQAGLTVAELRQQCQTLGIQWRDAHGKNRHLKKTEMLQAIARMARLKQLAIQKSTPRVDSATLPTFVPPASDESETNHDVA